MCQSLVVGWRDPWMIGWPRWDMTAEDLVKVAVQPASHSWPTDKRLPEARDGKRWVDVAWSDSWGKFNLALCVELIVEWFGRSTWTPSGLGWTSRRTGWGAVLVGAVKKWLVAPVSRIVEWQSWLHANSDFILLDFMLALPRLHSVGTKLDWQPPLRSLKVASSLCPVALRRQVALVWRRLEVTPWVQQ